MKQTIWRPDTCECEIVLTWDDDSVPASESAVHELTRFNRKCSAHSGNDGKEQFDAAIEENRRKNYTFAEVRKVLPSLTPEFYKWSFDNERNLIVKLNGPDDEKKNAIRSLLNARFGPEKVRLE